MLRLVQTIESEYVDLSKFERLHELTVWACDAVLDDKKAVKKSKAKRLESGQHLLDLKAMIDSDPDLLDEHGSWWEFFDYWFVKDQICSRRDGEKRMALARDEDPEGALAEERRRNREAKAKQRAKEARAADMADVSRNEGEENQQHKEEGSENTRSSQPKVAPTSDESVASPLRSGQNYRNRSDDPDDDDDDVYVKEFKSTTERNTHGFMLFVGEGFRSIVVATIDDLACHAVRVEAAVQYQVKIIAWYEPLILAIKSAEINRLAQHVITQHGRPLLTYQIIASQQALVLSEGRCGVQASCHAFHFAV